MDDMCIEFSPRSRTSFNHTADVNIIQCMVDPESNHALIQCTRRSSSVRGMSSALNLCNRDWKQSLLAARSMADCTREDYSANRWECNPQGCHCNTDSFRHESSCTAPHSLLGSRCVHPPTSRLLLCTVGSLSVSSLMCCQS